MNLQGRSLLHCSLSLEGRMRSLLKQQTLVLIH